MRTVWADTTQVLTLVQDRRKYLHGLYVQARDAKGPCPEREDDLNKLVWADTIEKQLEEELQREVDWESLCPPTEDWTDPLAIVFYEAIEAYERMREADTVGMLEIFEVQYDEIHELMSLIEENFA